MIPKGVPRLPGLPSGLPDIELPTGGLSEIGASIFPTFDVRSAMPALPVRAPVQTKAASSPNAPTGTAQNGQANQSKRQGEK